MRFTASYLLKGYWRSCDNDGIVVGSDSRGFELGIWV